MLSAGSTEIYIYTEPALTVLHFCRKDVLLQRSQIRHQGASPGSLLWSMPEAAHCIMPAVSPHPGPQALCNLKCALHVLATCYGWGPGCWAVFTMPGL